MVVELSSCWLAVGSLPLDSEPFSHISGRLSTYDLCESPLTIARLYSKEKWKNGLKLDISAKGY